jgi:AraC-like DNA-binding protein
VAADLGFYDQAHFTRHFKRHVAVTPARFARGRARPAGPGPSLTPGPPRGRPRPTPELGTPP